MRQYSYSSILKYKKCPKLYYFARVKKLPGVRSPMGEKGLSIHEFIYEYTKHLKNNNLQTDFTATNDIINKISAKFAPTIIEDVESVMNRFAERFKLDLNTFIGAEYKIALDKNWNALNDFFHKSTLFRGVIDRLDWQDNDISITDYKYSFKQADKMQLKIYAWLASILYPDVQTFHLNIFNLRFWTLEENLTLTKNDISNVPKRLMGIINHIEKDKNFKKTPGEYCYICSYVNNCGALEMSESNELNKLPNEEKAVNFAKRVHIATQLLRKAKKLLRLYVEEYGDIPMDNGLSMGLKAEPRIYIDDIEEFCEICWNNDIDPFNFLKVDMRTAKGLFNNEDIKKLARVKYSKKLDMKGDANENKKFNL